MLSFALALSISLPAPAPAPPADDQRLSLEELLERYRGLRDARLGELREQFDSLFAELQSLAGKPGAPGLQVTFERLRALGPVSAPLLVEHLDPGVDASDSALLSAQLVARALRDISTVAVTNDLLAMLQSGTTAGQLNTLRVLARSKHGDRVGPALRDYANGKTGARREGALMALAELGGAENVAFLGELLKQEDAELVRQALAAVTAAASPSVAGSVNDLVNATTAGAAQVRGIISFYEACPQVVGEEQLSGLLRLARGAHTSSDDAALLLELIGDFHKAFSSSFKKELRKVADSSDKDVAEGALVALVRGGDRGAKRELLEPYDERVEESRSWARAFEDRGDIYYRIEDYKSARKDYEEALRSGSNSSRDTTQVRLQIARCHALTGKLKDAKEWIEKTPIPLGQLRALADDPAFAELRESSRYREVFRLEE